MFVTLTCFGRRGTCGWSQSCRPSTAGCSLPSRWPAPPLACPFPACLYSRRGIESAKVIKYQFIARFQDEPSYVRISCPLI